jgi:predicted MFS family arabinose efflux permease
MKLKIALCAFLLLLLSLGFSIMLTTASMEKVYTEAIISEYRVVALDLQRGLDRALKFGKRLDKFTGIERVLDDTRAQIFKNVVLRHTPAGYQRKMLREDDIVISIVLPDGRILHSTNRGLGGETLPTDLRALLAPLGGDKGAPPSFVKHLGQFSIALPITDAKGVAAHTVISFGDDQVERLLAPFFDHNLKVFAGVMVCGMALLILALNLVTHAAPLTSGLPGRRISVLLFLVVGSAQIVFAGMNLRAFRDEFLAINQTKAETLMALLKEDVEFFFAKGLRLETLSGLDQLLGDIIAASPELRDIAVYDAQGRPAFVASHQGAFDYRTGAAPGPGLDPGPLEGRHDPRYRARVPLMREGEPHATLVANVSRQTMLRKLTEIFKDSATVLVISILFFVEMLILANLFIKDQYARTNGTGGAGGPPAGQTPGPACPVPGAEVPFGAIRPAAFLFLLGIDMCISFLPLYMKTLPIPELGLSHEMVLGLPISVEMLFVGVALLATGPWIDRRGWHEPFWLGLGAALGGTVWSALAPDALHFIASRGLVGLGYGAFIMAAQGFIVRQTDRGSKAQGMAQLWAGVFAGSICGGAAGAMMAERVGFRPVLLAGTVILVCAGAYALTFLRRTMARPTFCALTSGGPAKGHLTPARALRFLTNRDVFGLVALSSIPASLAFVGFMYYFSPIYLADLGQSQSDIGRVYMLYGVCLIYVAPYLAKFLDRAGNQKFLIFLSGATGCLGFTTYYFFGGLEATALTALLLGVSGSLDASRAFVLKLRASHELGEGTAMSLFNSVGRTGQIVGPMLFGWLLLTFGMPDAVTYFGMGYLAITVLFTLCTRSETTLAAKGLLHTGK